MPTSYKVLGQLVPTANTLSTLYTVPANTQTVTSSVVVCNQGTSTNIRLAVRPAGASITASHYIVYDSIVNANDSLILTIGVTANTTDVISAYAGTGNVSFNLYGSEITP
jgi:hypothetical protein